MRIGILVDLYNISGFDPGAPNPGIGGTQYMSLCLAQLLAAEYDVTVFTDWEFDFSGMSIEPRSHIKLLTTEDVLIVSVVNFDADVDVCRAEIIAWAHNMKDARLDRLAARAKALVVISPPQYDLLRWHAVRDKMCVIPYPFESSLFRFQASFEDYIVYLGALVPAKGFHHYAQALPRFLAGRRTKLLVIGGSQTYGENGGGHLKVTSASYETIFWDVIKPFVSTRQVEFLGNLGVERFSLISNAKLALTNPTGASETFCISNFECMSLGVPVIGGYHKGMTATLYPANCLHIHHPRQISKKLNRLLDDQELLQKLRPQVRKFVEKNSDIPAVITKWKQIISGLPTGQRGISSPFFADWKIPIWLFSKFTGGLTFAKVDAQKQRWDRNARLWLGRVRPRKIV